MLTKRIIPCLDIKDGRTVKGTNFVNLRDAGDPVALAAVYGTIAFLSNAITTKYLTDSWGRRK